MTMNRIENKVLYSLMGSKAEEVPDDGPTLIDRIVKFVEEELASSGDRIVVQEAENLGFESPHRNKVRMLSEIIPEAKKVASALVKKCDIKIGDNVQMSMHNNTDYFIPVLGIWMAGGVVSLSDPSLRVDVMQRQIEGIGTKIIFCSPDNVNDILEASKDIKDVKVIMVNSKIKNEQAETLEDFIEGVEVNLEALNRCGKPSELSQILWSSGTTGEPKGILHRHITLIRNLKLKLMDHEPESEACMFQTTCQFHSGGFAFSLTYGLAKRTKLVTMPINNPPSVPAMLNAIHINKPYILMLGSHHAVRLTQATPDQLTNKDLTSVRGLLAMGVCMHPTFPDEVKHVFPNAMCINGYGSSEASGVVFGRTYEHMGKLLPGVSLKVVDPETGEALGPNQPGEMLVKTGSMMVDYINVDQQTIDDTFDHEGFFKTGDLVEYNEEGYIFYKDRIKALIKYQNFHLYPTELEAIISKMDGVDDVCVFGIKEPSVQELVAAAVVKTPGSTITDEEIIEHVAASVDDFKRLRGGVFFVDSLPRTMPGKLQRKQVLDKLKILFPNLDNN